MQPPSHPMTPSPQLGGKKPLMPLEEALSRIRAAVQPLPAQSRPLADCLGHVLAQDVLAQVSVPAFDNSAMDGYALRSQDVLAAGPDHAWPVSQRVPAGSQPWPLQPGSVARIFTGAPLPSGADAVVPQEQVQVGEDGGVRLSAPLRPGQHVRRLGEDFQQGELLLRAGVRLTPAHLGLAASAGLPELWVRPRPRVALVSTGDELFQPGQPLPEGGIYDANRFSLAGLLQAWGIPFVDLGRVPDTLEGSRSALAQAAAQADVVLSSGGVSVGEEDHWRAALSALGEVHAWALAIKPGKPLTFGQVPGPHGRTVQVLGLPGNPVAAVVTALLALDPLLAALEGAEASPPKAWPMIAGFDWPRPDARREFLRASLGADGRLQLHPRQGSAMLSSCTGSDGLIDNPPGQVIQPGDVVRFLPWGSWGLRG